MRFHDSLSSNKLTNYGKDMSGFQALTAALSSGSAVLTSIDVGYNKLDEEAALGIVRAVRQHDKMTNLGLARCKIGPTGAKEVADYVSGSAVLTSLNLSMNHLNPQGAATIAEALKSGMSVLKKLDLSSNFLDGAAMQTVRDLSLIHI